MGKIIIAVSASCRRISFFVFLSAFFLIPWISAEGGSFAPVSRTWVSRGIGGGGALFAPTISPHDPDLVFMSTDMSSMFRSSDFGRQWETLNFLDLQAGVDTHVRFTSDPQILYTVDLADEQRTPVKSTNGGRQWSALAGDPTGGETYYLFADLQSASRILLSDWNNLYFSDDGGDSFSTVHTGSLPDYGLNVAGVFWDGRTIFVATSDGLIVSSDNGKNFSLFAATGFPSGAVIVSFAGAHENTLIRLFAVLADSGDIWPGWGTGGMYDVVRSAGNIYRLDWGQTEWVQVNNGIATHDHPVFIRMARNEVDTVWAAGGDVDNYTPVVYKSTDGGMSWNSVFLTSGNKNIATGWSGDGGDSEWWFGEYALGFAVSPDDPNRAVLTDLGFVHVTHDGGASWNQAYVHQEDENPAGFPISAGSKYRGIGLEPTSAWWLHWSDAQTITAAFTDIQGMRSADGGNSWTAGSALGLTQNSTYHIVQEPVNGRLFAATATVHDLYQSTYLADSDIDGGDGQVMVSSDNGERWEVFHDFDHPVVWLEIDPINTQRMYASVVHSTEGGIYLSDNLSNGVSTSWVPLSPPPRTEGHPFIIRVLEDGTIVATYSGRRDDAGTFTESSGVFVSADGGKSWSDRSHAGMRRWTKDLVIDPHDPDQNTWYVCVFSHWGAPPNEVGGLYRTKDRGLNWTRISDLYRVESCTVDPLDGNILYLSTETQGLWVTENLKSASPSFRQLTSYPFRQPTRLFFNPYDQEEIWVTNFGGGLRVSVPPELSVKNGGYNVTSELWAKAVLEAPGSPVTLVWKMVGADITPSGDQVISGYFYADPNDFAYGSQYNPELFVKIYIADNGWCNIAFNHVTVDDVDVYSAHNYAGSATQSATTTLTHRLAEHQYNGVSIDTSLQTSGQESATSSSSGYTLTSDLWAKAILQPSTGPLNLVWKEVGTETTPSGDQVVSGYFYANPDDFAYGSVYNPEVFVKVYIAANGWANIAFNHVTVDGVDISSAHDYSGIADQSGTATLNDRLVEHQYDGVSMQ